MAWARRRRNGSSVTVAIDASSGATPATSSPGSRRTAESRGTRRGRAGRSPSESIVPPVVTTATRGSVTRRRAGSAAGSARHARARPTAVRRPATSAAPPRAATNRSIRPISRRIRNPSIGPSAYSGIGLSHTAEAERARIRTRPEKLAAVVEIADAGRCDDRQPDPGLAQLGDDPKPDRLDRSARERAVAVLQVGLARLRIEPQRLDGVDGGQTGNPVALRQPGVLEVVVVGGDLEDHRVP